MEMSQFDAQLYLWVRGKMTADRCDSIDANWGSARDEAVSDMETAEAYFMSLSPDELVDSGLDSDTVMSIQVAASSGDPDQLRAVLEDKCDSLATSEIVSQAASEGSDFVFRDIYLLSQGYDTSSMLIGQYSSMSAYEHEITTGFKSVLEGPTRGYDEYHGVRWDVPGSTLNEGMLTECSISDNGDGTYRCESEYLGNFNYDPNEWTIGYRDVPDTDDGTGHPMKLPILTPCNAFKPEGERTLAGMSSIPDGVKTLDYSFADMDMYSMSVEGKDFLGGIVYKGLQPPASCKSMHCAFMDCDNLFSPNSFTASVASDTNGYIDYSNVDDFSYICSGCGSLVTANKGVPLFMDSSFPGPNAKDVTGMFTGCSKMYDVIPDSSPFNFLEDWSFSSSKVFGLLPNWSDYPGLHPLFSYTIDEDSSNPMKQIQEQEEAEQRDFRATYSPETHTEAENASYEDSNARAAARNAEKVTAGDVRIRTLDEVSEETDNTFGPLLGRIATDAVTFLGIKGMTGLFTNKKLVKWGVAIAGTVLVDQTGLMARGIESLLTHIRDGMSDGAGKTALTKFIDFFHVPTAEEKAAKEAERFDRYRDLALRDSLQTNLEAASGMDIDKSMRISGKTIAEYGVLANAGETGNVAVIKDIFNYTGSAINAQFDEYMADGVLDDNEKASMRGYYLELFEGAAAYGNGAIEGINGTYKPGDSKYSSSMAGLQLVEQAYVGEVMASMSAYGNPCPFFDEADWEYVNSLGIPGVGNLHSGMSAPEITTSAPEPVSPESSEKASAGASSSGKTKTRGEIAEEATGFTGDEFDEPESEAETEAR